MVVGELKAQYKRYISIENHKALNSSQLVYEFSKKIPELQEDIEYKESFYIFMFNNAAKLVGFSKIGEGGLTATHVDVRVILQHTLLSCATAVILLHNHPSGQLHPSIPDKTITKHIKEALQLCDLQLLDHLIISKTNYYSFADEGIL
jgi:DNA repair protein RadC